MALTLVSRANAVPIALTGPTRYLSATQAHTAGNLLVALFHNTNGQVGTISNLAGDTWIKSALSPYLPGTIHHHEMWYCLKTKGHPADIITITGTIGAELVMTIYEFAPTDPSLQVVYLGDAAANLQVDSGTPPTINSGLISGITRASVLIALYRDSLGIVPTSPSGTQTAALNSGGVTSYYDSYQYNSAPASVHAVAGANNTFPQWTILASAFSETPILGVGCTVEIKIGVSSGGAGCGNDLGQAAIIYTIPPPPFTPPGLPPAPPTPPAPPPPPPVPPPPGSPGPAPQVYTSRPDRLISLLPALPAMGPAGSRIVDPLFASPILRVTDGNTRSDSINVAFRTPDAATARGWPIDGSSFWVSCTDGSTRLFTFDPVAVAATMVSPQLPFAAQPEFDDVTANLLYGVGTAVNHVTMVTYNTATGGTSTLIDLSTLPGVPDLTNTFTNAVSCGGGKLTVLFGGTAQDLHYLILVRPLATPSSQYFLNTLTLPGLGFHCHSQWIDRTGRYLVLFPSNADFVSGVATSQIYILDLTTNAVVRLPSDWGGHTANGYGYMVNQDVASGPWDAAQWSIRALGTPLAPTNLITPILTPARNPATIEFGEHSSWGNARASALLPMITGTYLFGDRSVWRPWDDEIVAIATDGSSVVNRFAHHRSLVAKDANPAQYEFVYTPRPAVSPNGRFAVFSSNWGKTLGVDPATGLYRTDIFLITLT